MLQSWTAFRHFQVLSRPALVKRLTVACFAGALALSLGGFPAYAADDEEEPFELQFLKKMFGITDQAPIEYRERSPLVVPPTRDLPSPETVSAESNPAWPQDAAKTPKKKKEQKLSVTDQQIAGNPISPYELDKGRKAGAGLTPTSPSAANDRGAPLSPSELGYKGGLFGGLFKDQDKGEVATFPGEAPRTTLTSPPTGYMTPSPNQPYGLSAKKEAPKPYKLEDRGTEQR
ncbi:MAG: hypothetical protein K8F62_08340 [Pseudorhodoplanes sp.]|nr:hypothetical protein [Pseudorhodoplanes sp.]